MVALLYWKNDLTLRCLVTANSWTWKKRVLHYQFVYPIKCRRIRESRYKWEILEIETHDVLDKALVKAKANKAIGAIDAPTYYIIEDKINSLKKLKFT